MPLFLGNSEVERVLVGDTEIAQIYQGTNEIWSNVKTVDLGEGTSWDIKTLYPYLYKKLTADNFFVLTASAATKTYGIRMDPGDATVYWVMDGTIYKNYDPSTGKLDCYIRISGKVSQTAKVKVIMVTKTEKLQLLTNFNVSNVPGYQNFTVDNFLISSTSGTHYYNSFYAQSYIYSGSGTITVDLVKSYNQNTGVLTCYLRQRSSNTDGTYHWFDNYTTAGCTVYLRTEI